MQLTEAQTWAALGMLTAAVLGMLTFSTRTMTRTMTFLVDGIRGEVQGIRSEVQGLRGEMDGLRGVVEGQGQHIDRIWEEFRRENDGLRGEIRREMNGTREEIRREMDGTREEVRREMDGVREEVTALREAESLTRTKITELHDASVQLRGDVNTLTHRVTFLEQSVTEGFASVDRRFEQVGR